MDSFEGLRRQVAARLNLIRCKNDQTGLFGPGKPLGRYDGAVFAYFTGEAQAHPITALAYIRAVHGVDVASEVLRITLEVLGAAKDGLPAHGLTRLELWQAANPASHMALEVPDEIAYRIIQPAIDYMMAHHGSSNYRHAVLVGQIVAWYLGDPLMECLPTKTAKLEVAIPDHIRQEYQRFVVRFVRTVYEMNALKLPERMQALPA